MFKDLKEDLEIMRVAFTFVIDDAARRYRLYSMMVDRLLEEINILENSVDTSTKDAYSSGYEAGYEAGITSMQAAAKEGAKEGAKNGDSML